MGMQVVVQLDILYDTKARQKVLKAVSSLPGIKSLEIDMDEKKLILTGDTDPVQVVRKLRKKWSARLISVGPEPEEKKEKEAKENTETPKTVEENNPNNYHNYNCYPEIAFYTVDEPPRSCFFF